MAQIEITLSYGRERAGSRARLYASLKDGSPAALPFEAVNSEKLALTNSSLALVAEGFLDEAGKITFQWDDESEHEIPVYQAAVELVDGWRLSNPIDGSETEPAPLLDQLTEAAGTAPTELFVAGHERNLTGIATTVHGEEAEVIANLANEDGDGDLDVIGGTIQPILIDQTTEASTTVVGAHTGSATTITVADGSVFSEGEYIEHDESGEWMEITGISGNDLTVVRAVSDFENGRAISDGDTLKTLTIGNKPFWLFSPNSYGYITATDQWGDVTPNIVSLTQMSCAVLARPSDHGSNNSSVQRNPPLWGHDDNSGPYGDARKPFITHRDGSSVDTCYFVCPSSGLVSIAWPVNEAHVGVMSFNSDESRMRGSVDKTHGTDTTSIAAIDDLNKRSRLGFQKAYTQGAIAVRATWNVELTEEQHEAVVDVLREYQGLEVVEAEPVE